MSNKLAVCCILRDDAYFRQRALTINAFISGEFMQTFYINNIIHSYTCAHACVLSISAVYCIRILCMYVFALFCPRNALLICILSVCCGCWLVSIPVHFIASPGFYYHISSFFFNPDISCSSCILENFIWIFLFRFFHH